MKIAEEKIRLTQYSHGAGCGCKISPQTLDKIISKSGTPLSFPGLLVGNQSKDDAAVFDLDGETSIISTTDFFMPIVDDAYEFGGIAATNAISDIYAMGGTPIMAIAILGWPLDKLPVELAGRVIEGGRDACTKAGIPLAGGHSIDAPEPIFGLAVTGRIQTDEIKKNSSAKPRDLIYLTKPLGIGMVTTAQKKGLATDEDLATAKMSMLKLNSIGAELAHRHEVNAITDVTGFGLGGHLVEMCEGSGCGAEIVLEKVPRFPFVDRYLSLKCYPGGTQRNWDSYGDKIELMNEEDKFIIADPQTSGGLLIAVEEKSRNSFESFMESMQHQISPIGKFTEQIGIKIL
ncbi:MAG: selenide, water dikinase SelD [Flavobacteriales bacterium]|nr:selenide, water dikinase SelD [Flavobacteriales bacterium]